MALDGFRVGHRPRIGLVLSRAVAVQRQLVEQIRGRRSGVIFGLGVAVGEGEGAVVRRHGGCLSAGGNSAALIAAFTAIPEPGTEKRRTQRAEAERRMADVRAFCFAMQSRGFCPGGGKCEAAAIARRLRAAPFRAARRLRQIAAREGRARPSVPGRRAYAARTNQSSAFRRDPATAPLCRAVLTGGGETGEIGGNELRGKMREERGGAERARSALKSSFTGTRSRISIPAA